MLASEFALVQPHLCDAQIPPVVYLSGVLMFAAGRYQQGAANTGTIVIMVLVLVLEGLLLVIGVIITVRAYSRDDK